MHKVLFQMTDDSNYDGKKFNTIIKKTEERLSKIKDSVVVISNELKKLKELSENF